MIVTGIARPLIRVSVLRGTDSWMTVRLASLSLSACVRSVVCVFVCVCERALSSLLCCCYWIGAQRPHVLAGHSFGVHFRAVHRGSLPGCECTQVLFVRKKYMYLMLIVSQSLFVCCLSFHRKISDTWGPPQAPDLGLKFLLLTFLFPSEQVGSGGWNCARLHKFKCPQLKK